MGGGNIEDKDQAESWVYCRSCKEGFIKRFNSGLGHFKYGKAIRKAGNRPYNPVDLFVMGTIKIRCFRCGAWNFLSFFPNDQLVFSNKEEKNG